MSIVAELEWRLLLSTLCQAEAPAQPADERDEALLAASGAELGGAQAAVELVEQGRFLVRT